MREGKQAYACAGRRVLSPTKQRMHAVFRAFSAFVMKTQTHRSPLAPTYVLAHFTKQNSTLCCFENFCSTHKARIPLSAPNPRRWLFHRWGFFYLLSDGAFRDAPQSVEQCDEFLHGKGQRHVFGQGYAHPPDWQAGTDVNFEEFAAFKLLCGILAGDTADAHSATGEFEH